MHGDSTNAGDLTRIAWHPDDEALTCVSGMVKAGIGQLDWPTPPLEAFSSGWPRLLQAGREAAVLPVIVGPHENAIWNLRSNFVDNPTDCPQRDERLGWTGDITVFAPIATFLFDSIGFFSSWLRDLAAEQHTNSAVPAVPSCSKSVPAITNGQSRSPYGENTSKRSATFWTMNRHVLDHEQTWMCPCGLIQIDGASPASTLSKCLSQPVGELVHRVGGRPNRPAPPELEQRITELLAVAQAPA
jgi:hypothetical protein